MNNYAAYVKLSNIALEIGAKIEYRIEPNKTWIITPKARFGVVDGDCGETLIFLGQERIAAVVGQPGGRDHVKLAEEIVAKANSQTH
jgi:hypothetical protein